MYRTPSPTTDDGVPPAVNLPQPAIASSARKTARFQTGLKVHWARFKSQLGTGSALSESAIDASGAESTEGSSNYRRFIEKSGGRNTPAVVPNDDGPVDEIVVDNQFLVPGEKSVTQPSEVGDKQYIPDGHNSHQHTTEPRLNSHGIPGSESYFESTNSLWDKHPFLVAIRYRILPFLWRFFNLSFHDPEAESHYLKERYYTKKRLAFFTSLFFVLNWVLAAALLPRPFMTIDKVFYYGIAPAMVVPGPFFVLFDVYRRTPQFYQLWLTSQTYMWALYNILFIHLCGFYGQHSYWSCGKRDFIGLFYFTIGLPMLALFGMHQHRLPAMLAAVAIAVLMGVLIIPWRTSWSRNLINFVIFQVFLLYLHFMYETAERRLHKLRDQLKTQYKATQKAQVSERKAADSKRRLTSYIFHEVRVPLNTALLATQNMAAEMTLSKEHDVEFNALEGSLSMMSKVLNDVLDFNRMDSGRFESVSKPYQFHTVMRSMLVPLKLAADARGLELISEFDPAIDETIRKANRSDEAKRGLTAGADTPSDDEDDEAFVLGDEMRLRQIITNLASNSAKFTESGGKIFIRTKLVAASPVRPNPFASQPQSSTSGATRASGGNSPASSRGNSHMHDEEKGIRSHQSHSHLGERESRDSYSHSRDRLIEQIVVRIEVEDTGVGIRRRDLVDNRLFSAFNQTEVGRLQGGKGTGLGLALVRHIVSLSGGRLGVKSERDVGSMFWVELSLGVGRRVNNAIARNKSKDDALDNIARSRIIERSGFVLDASSGVGPEPHDITPSTIASNPSDVAFMPTLPIESNAALKTIIEHGGMVELASRRPRVPPAPNEVPIVVTRTMDSTDSSILANAVLGQTEAPEASQNSNTPSTTNASTAQVSTESDPTFAQPTPTASARATVRQRPSFVALPERQQFNFPPTESPANGDSKRPGPSPAPDKKGSTLSGSTIVETPNTLNVLVVDDDPLTRKLMSRMLTRLGCVCDTAENGLIALEMLLGPMTGTPSTGDPPSSTPSDSPAASAQAMSKYAVVFLDNQMPLCSGLEVMRQLRSIGRRDFVVGVTGNALKEDQEEYYEAGVDHVLTKPVLERSLKQMLVMADERRRTQAQASATPS
ncbi:Autoinducer 2 sensor kinase/phosphatase LuxQ [Vibrio cholerae O1 biovar El Tor str, N16961] [Rhizoctonia solani]|uniref:histidine kinase n=1 Tax=Rhizoctonia solani TaxID=456999 RepID=A0A0K6GHW9_9AGAM|nr:Autoinducer 2 sensor kinase/phosphatase LuxQ [Vibrio cholerae O1 biovar El Tor str, N16961] [Rhizoctonia solani]